MSEKLNTAIAVIGIDIGKNSFHVVGHDQRGAIVLHQKWSRGQVAARFANMPPCLIGMEACVGAHHLSRKLKALGHDARLMPAKYVRPYSKGQKNDFRDAEAIAEAVLARQITEAFPWDTVPKYLIRDNDRAFGGAFKARIRAMGIRDRPTSFRSPWQNGYVERLIGSIRRECTDHLIVFNAEHLRRILAKYVAYYNDVRTHVSLGKDAPYTRAIERFGDVVAHPILGGLHHRYARI